jgi:hypothetical protein
MRLERNSLGRLRLTLKEGSVHEPVMAIRAFPIHDAEGSIALVGADGHECAWIESIAALDADSQAALKEELKEREFMPEIQKIVSVSSFVAPSTWLLETDRGPCELTLKGEEDIRRLGRTMLLILDTHGVHFMIRNPLQLDRQSRKLLDRFL